MSKIKRAQEITEMIDLCIDGLSEIARWLRETCGGAAQAAEEQKPPEPEKPMITFEEVRAALAEKSRAGHTAEVKALINKHGADKLSAVDESEYAALLKEAEVLGNAG